VTVVPPASGACPGKFSLVYVGAGQKADRNGDGYLCSAGDGSTASNGAQSIARVDT